MRVENVGWTTLWSGRMRRLASWQIGLGEAEAEMFIASRHCDTTWHSNVNLQWLTVCPVEVCTGLLFPTQPGSARLQRTLNSISLQDAVFHKVGDAWNWNSSEEFEHNLHTCKVQILEQLEQLSFNVDLSKLLLENVDDATPSSPLPLPLPASPSHYYTPVSIRSFNFNYTFSIQ